EQRDELATFQLTEPHSLPSSRNESIADWQGQVRGLLPCGISTRPMSGWGQPRNILPPRHSPLMLAALMIGVQRAISLFTNVASACWPRFSLWRPSLPSSAKRFLTVSSSKDSSSAALSLSTMGCGVPFGANSAHQGAVWNSGSPASRVVGMSGNTWLRSADAVAYAL